MATSSRRPVPDTLPDRPDTSRLHEATDRLNKVLLRCEEALSELKLGVSAAVTLDEDEQGWYRALRFGKSGGQFKLLIETGVDGDPDVNITPLVSASRETRLEAVNALPELYKRLLAAFEAEIERVNTSIKSVEELTDDLRAKARK